MPQLINGCGTWYYGKSQLNQHQGTCEKCGRAGMLRTYDTTKYFVIVMVPLLPLGKLKILDECPKCSHHRVAKLKVWEREGQAAVEGALSAFEAEPDSRDAALRALIATIGFFRRDDFNELSGALVEAFPDDAKIRMLVADGHERFGQHEQSEAAYYEAVALPGSADARHNLILYLCRKGDPDAALELLMPLGPAPSEDDDQAVALDRDVAGQTVAVAEALGVAARADEALALLDERFAGRPDIAGDAACTGLRTRLEKAAKKGKAVKPVFLGANSKQREGKGLARYAAAAAVVAVPLLALGVFAAVSLNKAKARMVHVVNGSPAAYAVSIDGEPGFMVTPGHPPAIPMAEGDHTFQIELPGGQNTAGRTLPAGTFRVNGSFFGRPFSSTAFVLNPDGLGLVIREVHVWGNVSTQPSAEVLPPSYFHEQPGVRHAFTPPPQQISTKSSGEVRVGLAQETPAFGDGLGWVFNEVGPEAGMTHALRYLAFDADDPVAMAVAAGVDDDAAFDAVLGPLLAERPVRVNAHRTAQNRREAAGESDTLVAEYAALVDAESENPDLHYLLGRVSGAAGVAHFERAIALDPRHPGGHLGRGYQRLVRGEAASALDDLEVAAAADGDPLSAAGVRDLAAWATGEPRAIRGVAPRPTGVESLQELRIALQAEAVRAGDAGGAARAFGIGFAAADRAVEWDLAEDLLETEGWTPDQLKERFVADAAYAAGDPQPMRTVFGAGDDPAGGLYPAPDAWYAAVLAGDAAAAMSALEAGGGAEVFGLDVLLPTVALAATRGVDPGAAGLAAAERLGSDPDTAPLAAALDPSAGLDFATLFDAEVLPALKLPLALIAAANHPTLANDAYALGGKLNGDPRWPHLLYADLLK